MESAENTALANKAVLAIWNDCRAEHLSLYEHWYRTEHLAERLAIPDFIRGRRYVGAPGRSRREFFTYYETESTETLRSKKYLERVNNPTELTREIMSDAFMSVSRTVCNVAFSTGSARGSHAVTFETGQGRHIATQLQRLMDDNTIVRAEIWAADRPDDDPVSSEQEIRGRDDHVATAVFIETTTLREAVRVAGDMREYATTTPEIFQLLCELTA